MYFSTAIAYNTVVKLKLLPSIFPVCTQLRYVKRRTHRKDRWLPMAPSKVFRIPKHPEVPADEKELFEDLLEEYYRKQDSLRVLFKEELAQKEIKKEDPLTIIQRDEEEFKLLLEENKKENERTRIIRETTLEKEFQEKQLEWLLKADELKKEKEKTKILVDEIIKIEKEKYKTYITFENIDEQIELALENPVNVNFAISLDGKVKWEGKPPLYYEADIARRIEEGKDL